MLKDLSEASPHMPHCKILIEDIEKLFAKLCPDPQDYQNQKANCSSHITSKRLELALCVKEVHLIEPTLKEFELLMKAHNCQKPWNPSCGASEVISDSFIISKGKWNKIKVKECQKHIFFGLKC